MIRKHRLVYLLLALSWAVAASGQVGSVPEDSPQVALDLVRSHPPAYTPGETVEIIISIEGQGRDNLRALGLEEVLPVGWRLVSVQGYEGTPPHILPEPGGGTPLEFAWISPPQLPCVFSYIVAVPENDWGEKELYGTLLFRLDAGPHRTLPTVTLLYGPEPEPPELLVRGANPMEIQEGDTWSDPGCTALDHDKQDITAYLTTSGVVDTATPGVYTLEYRVTSQATGLSASATRTVHVSAVSASEDSGDSSSPRRILPPQELRRQGQETPKKDALTNSVIDTPQEPPGNSEPPPGNFPDLSAYKPVPRERPEEQATARTREAGESGMDEAKRQELAVTTVAQDNGTIQRTSNASTKNTGNSPTEHEKNSGQPGEPDSGRLTRHYWVAGILILVMLLAGIPLAWYTAYGRPFSRTSKNKQNKD